MNLDEMLWRLGDALRHGRLSEWEEGFAKSVMGRSKRRAWRPSPKQIGTMRRIVGNLKSASVEVAGSLIDDGDTMQMGGG